MSHLDTAVLYCGANSDAKTWVHPMIVREVKGELWLLIVLPAPPNLSSSVAADLLFGRFRDDLLVVIAAACWD